MSVNRTHVESLNTLWAPHAWLDEGWCSDVLLEVGKDGHWSAITPQVTRELAQQKGATLLEGAVLPGLVNAHSHAFQRAFAGLTERRENLHDDFWSWRDRMYQVALAITPDEMQAIAAQLYVELLRGGYTQVCEFHYLQHAENGGAYDDPLTMAWRLNAAAQETGIGITHLPVLYERSGFTASGLRDDQRRFATNARWVSDAKSRITREAASLLCNAGVAIHSLRAAHPSSMRELVDAIIEARTPIHIHVAEQTGEVDDCLKNTGRRSIEWLCENFALDKRWQLVHATHATRAEIEAVARSGAGVVICPTTEANLGDGLTDVPHWLEADTALTIGSDSHATRDWSEELRLLEYGQRLHLRARNVSASPQDGVVSTAERLWRRVLAGSASVAGLLSWGLRVGARADALHVDMNESAMLGISVQQILDARVFSSPSAPFRDVMVAGLWAIRDGVHIAENRITQRFVQTMRRLWR